MKHRWIPIRYRLEVLGVRGIAGLIPLMSRRRCAQTARFLGSVAFRLDRRGKAVALANLEAAFPGRFTPAERERIALESYRNFVRTMIDLFWSSRLNSKNYSQFAEVHGRPFFDERTSRGTGPVILTIHSGNWEWGNILLSFDGVTGAIVAEDFKNPGLNTIFNSLRETGGSTIIPQERSMVRLLKTVKRGHIAGMLPDLSMPLSQPAVILNTFGLKMRATMLHAVLAHRAGSPMLPFLGENLPDGRCAITCYPMLDIPEDATVVEIAQRCWDHFEPLIAQRPELWMWSYKHWRYRPKDADRPYPFYANTSSKFERELREQSAESPTG